jgi:hypothetical protein
MMLVKMMMSENHLSQSKVHVTEFWGTEGKRQKVSLNKRPSVYTCGRGGKARLSPNTSHVKRKRIVNTTLMMGHQADRVMMFV